MLNMAYQRKLETFETLTTTQNDTVIGGFCCSCSGSVKTAQNTLFNDVTLWQHMASIEQVITLNMLHHRKGSGGPVGLSVPSEGGRCPCMPAHMCVHVGKGGGLGMMQSHRQPPLQIQENCWLWDARRHQSLAIQQLLSPSDSSAVVAIALVFGQARLIWQSTALIDSWAWSSRGPEMTDDCLPEIARLPCKRSHGISIWVVLPCNIICH